VIDDTIPGRVAVLGDDIRFIRMVESMLGSEGIQVEPVTTPDVDEAVRVISATGCAAALVDLYMYGDAQGYRLVDALRDNPGTAGLPLIVTSGAHRELGRRAGYLVDRRCSVLLKPFRIEDLLDRLAGSRERVASGQRSAALAAPPKPFQLHGTVST